MSAACHHGGGRKGPHEATRLEQEDGLLSRRCVVIAAGLTMAVAPAAAAAGLEPHRAAYRLSLAGQTQPGDLIDVQGGLVIEWQLTCDGWLSQQRLGFIASTDDGRGFTHDVRFSSWEALDGQKLQYAVRSYQGASVEEEYRGEASLNGAGGSAHFRSPEVNEVELPAGTVFPTEHLELVLDDAVAGERFVSHKVFDGWGYDALTQITTAIGQSRMLDPAKGGAGQVRVWPVSMAYYNVSEQSDLPEFEANFLLDEHGVLRELSLHYGDFSLEATLEDLERLERPAC